MEEARVDGVRVHNANSGDASTVSGMNNSAIVLGL